MESFDSNIKRDVVSASPADTFYPASQQDGELADQIEQDGRSLLDRKIPFGLDRYFTAVSDLAAKPLALDAAIDVALRSLALADGRPHPQDKHAQALLRAYPDLAGPIRIAAMLANQLIATTGQGSAVPNRRSLALPRQIGPVLEDNRARYELLRLLGRGSSGTVCEAVDHLLSDSGHQARVAIKLIPVERTTVQLQSAEATKARRIEHPAVVRVLDRGLTDNGEVFLVYELVAGGDLQTWFDQRNRAISPTEAASLVAAIASGVQAAHSAGLVHCDLKPSNILMTMEGKPRISDFGVATVTQPYLNMHDDVPKGPVGNIGFSAPEQIWGPKGPASPLVDIYALGGLLYYLLTGVLPNGSTVEEVERNHSPLYGRRTPPSARSANPRVDKRLAAICARMMQPYAELRPSTASEVESDLRAWLERRPIAWMREPTWYRVLLWCRRSPLVAFLLLVCTTITLAGGFIGGYLTQLHSDASWAALRLAAGFAGGTLGVVALACVSVAGLLVLKDLTLKQRSRGRAATDEQTSSSRPTSTAHPQISNPDPNQTEFSTVVTNVLAMRGVVVNRRDDDKVVISAWDENDKDASERTLLIPLRMFVSEDLARPMVPLRYLIEWQNSSLVTRVEFLEDGVPYPKPSWTPEELSVLRLTRERNRKADK